MHKPPTFEIHFSFLENITFLSPPYKIAWIIFHKHCFIGGTHVQKYVSKWRYFIIKILTAYSVYLFLPYHLTLGFYYLLLLSRYLSIFLNGQCYNRRLFIVTLSNYYIRKYLLAKLHENAKGYFYTFVYIFFATLCLT